LIERFALLGEMLSTLVEACSILPEIDEMKKLALFILVVFAYWGALAQSPSQVRNLATFGRLWGYLKYYHSEALRGRPDWDSTLLKQIPVMEKLRSAKEFDSYVSKWYASLPASKLANVEVARSADSLVHRFSEADINAFEVPRNLKKELVKLYRYHVADTSRYATRFYGNHLYDHIIHTEDAHEQPLYPSREMRLLALFRYWNTIEYFYPHKNRLANWNRVLHKYIPVFLSASDSTQYHAAIRALIHELPDSHSFVQFPGEVYYFYPFRLDYIEGKYVIGQCDSLIAITNDYKQGDEVISINGISTRDREQELLQTTTGTNNLSRQRNIAQNLLKTGDSVVQVTFRRGDHSFTKAVALHSWPVYSKMKRAAAAPLWKQVDDGIWHVRFCSIRNPDTLRTLFRDIRNAQTVIWDMRDYPNFSVVTQLYKYMFNKQTALTEELTASDFYPGMFTRSPYHFTPSVSDSTEAFEGRMIILVDEHTQSLSESVAAVLRLRPNTLVMGRQTAGTTGNITWITLPGGVSVSYTGVGVVGMQESFEQGNGVKIDLPILLTHANVTGHKDFMLEQAIRHSLR
jgi:carboxyl-terminal processing protease